MVISQIGTYLYSGAFGDGGSDQFPGQKVDAHTGVKDFGARNYSGTLKRWYSADSVTAHIYDPQSLNKYAYVRNDPVNFVDPDGRQAISPREIDIVVYDAWPHYDNDTESWGWTYVPRVVTYIKGSTRNQPLDRWDDLSESCKRGLNTAVGGPARLMLLVLDRALDAKNMLQAATAGSVIDWRMLAAIGIRESGFENVYGVVTTDKNGTTHWGRGIFQIDSQHTDVSDAQAFDQMWAADWAVNLLESNYFTLLKRWAAGDLSFSNNDQFNQALAASYNFGTKNISGDPDKIDKGTTGNNYGSNVLDLMDCFD